MVKCVFANTVQSIFQFKIHQNDIFLYNFYFLYQFIKTIKNY
jgi:hypothetical protein